MKVESEIYEIVLPSGREIRMLCVGGEGGLSRLLCEVAARIDCFGIHDRLLILDDGYRYLT